MKIEKISEEDLASWREGPVAEAVLECLWAVYEAQKKMCLESYWAGKPWPQEHVLMLQYQAEMIGEVFEATKDDMMATMEQINGEPIRLAAD